MKLHTNKELIFLLMAFIAFSSCKRQKKITYIVDSTVVKVPIELPDTLKIEESFSIETTVSGNSGCSQFDRFETSMSNDTTYFSMYQKRDNQNICATVPIDIPITINYAFNSKGLKYLVFDGYDSLNKTLTVVDSIFIK